jgi:hypothetical protein
VETFSDAVIPLATFEEVGKVESLGRGDELHHPAAPVPRRLARVRIAAGSGS